MNLNMRRIMKPMSGLPPIALIYPATGYRWAEGARIQS
jgi:hypothetical protein